MRELKVARFRNLVIQTIAFNVYEFFKKKKKMNERSYDGNLELPYAL